MREADQWQVFMGIVCDSDSIGYREIEDPVSALSGRGLGVRREQQNQLKKLFRNLKRTSGDSTVGQRYRGVIRQAPQMTYRQLRDPGTFSRDFPQVPREDVDVVQSVLQDIVQTLGALEWPDDRMAWIRSE